MIGTSTQSLLVYPRWVSDKSNGSHPVDVTHLAALQVAVKSRSTHAQVLSNVPTSVTISLHPSCGGYVLGVGDLWGPSESSPVGARCRSLQCGSLLDEFTSSPRCSRASWFQWYLCPTGGYVSAPRTSSTKSTVSPSTTFNTVVVVATGSACATELAMTEHAGTTAAVTTAATNRVRVGMLGVCRKAPTGCGRSSRPDREARAEARRRLHEKLFPSDSEVVPGSDG